VIRKLTSDLLSEVLHTGKKSEFPTSTRVTLPCPENMQEIDDMDDVQFIARNTKLRASAIQVNPPNDGLARISHKEPFPSNEYVYTSYLGQGVDVYVLDSGINTQHSDFDSRAKLYNFVNTEADADLYGHGSHVSGIIGGRTYGVAKKCNIKGVKILDRVGAGDAYVAIEAIHWVISEAAKSGNPSIINLSLEGETNKGLNDAIQLAYANGIAVIGAAGNSHRDACAYSPASSPYAFAVGSINRSNQIDAESNYGQCVRLFAPGDRIISTGNTGASSQLSYTGTR
jgi:subtilisin family serine protease